MKTILISLQRRPVGILEIGDSGSQFRFLKAYVDDPDRHVLGLAFEEQLDAVWSARNRLPPWFSNLLPEGLLRDSIAARLRLPARNDTDVKTEASMLLALGADLPGAVTARSIDAAEAADLRLLEGPSGAAALRVEESRVASAQNGFSVAGVQLKFSLRKNGERFTMPLEDESGDWIVKMPDARFARLPRNEFAMMRLASRVGIVIPEVRMVRRSDLAGVPAEAWLGEEEAYAVRRFDRTDAGRVHMEDLLQVRMRYPESKYEGNFETVAALLFRGRDEQSLRQFIRRLTFCMAIANDDAHFKNWTVVYPDGRVPVISPAYDLVSVAPYSGIDRSTGLSFCGVRSYARLRPYLFQSLLAKLDAPPILVEEVTKTVEAIDSSLQEALSEIGDESIAAPIREHFEQVRTRLAAGN